jgi:hypothetical protein
MMSRPTPCLKMDGWTRRPSMAQNPSERRVSGAAINCNRVDNGRSWRGVKRTCRAGAPGGVINMTLAKEGWRATARSRVRGGASRYVTTPSYHEGALHLCHFAQL